MFKFFMYAYKCYALPYFHYPFNANNVSVQKPIFDSIIDKGNLFFDFKTGNNKFK